LDTIFGISIRIAPACGVRAFSFRVYGSGFCVTGSGFRISNFVLVSVLVFRVPDFGIRVVDGFGFSGFEGEPEKWEQSRRFRVKDFAGPGVRRVGC